MTSIKRLKSVIHSTAHHAMSGLSYIHPHIGKACMKDDFSFSTINLLKIGFNPNFSSISKELKLSTHALQDKFSKLLEAENIEIDILKSANITFEFHQDIWPHGCHFIVETNLGKKVEVTLDSLGKKAEILSNRS